MSTRNGLRSSPSVTINVSGVRMLTVLAAITTALIVLLVVTVFDTVTNHSVPQHHACNGIAVSLTAGALIAQMFVHGCSALTTPPSVRRR